MLSNERKPHERKKGKNKNKNEDEEEDEGIGDFGLRRVVHSHKSQNRDNHQQKKLMTSVIPANHNHKRRLHSTTDDFSDDENIPLSLIHLPSNRIHINTHSNTQKRGKPSAPVLIRRIESMHEQIQSTKSSSFITAKEQMKLDVFLLNRHEKKPLTIDQYSMRCQESHNRETLVLDDDSLQTSSSSVVLENLNSTSEYVQNEDVSSSKATLIKTDSSPDQEPMTPSESFVSNTIHPLTQKITRIQSCIAPFRQSIGKPNIVQYLHGRQCAPSRFHRMYCVQNHTINQVNTIPNDHGPQNALKVSSTHDGSRPIEQSCTQHSEEKITGFISVKYPTTFAHENYFLQKFYHQWNICSSIHLELSKDPILSCPQEQEISHRFYSENKITSMQFDSQGILLAVSDSKGSIRIYDFDQISSMDTITRRKQGRNFKKNKFATNPSNDILHTIDRNSPIVDKTALLSSVCPTISFQSCSRVTCVRWNPTNEDELAVSFMGTSEIRIYDLASMDMHGNPMFLRLLPSSQKGDGIMSLYFLPKASFIHLPSSYQSSSTSSYQLMSGGIRGVLQLWQITFPESSSMLHSAQHVCSQQRRAKVLWSIVVWKTDLHVNEGISDIKVIGPVQGSAGSFIIVAGSRGSIAVLDATSYSRKVFSTEMTPQLLQSWNLSSLQLRTHTTVRTMHRFEGIKHISLQSEHESKSSLQQGHQQLSLNLMSYYCSLIIITDLGNVLTMNLDCNRDKTNVWNISPSVANIVKLPDLIAPSIENILLPQELCLGKSLICIEDILSNRILVADRQNVSDGDPDTRYFVNNMSADAVALVIHPSNEWIVVGDNDKTFGTRLRLLQNICNNDDCNGSLLVPESQQQS